MSLKAKLEAVIYAAEEPVTLAQLAALFATDVLEWKAEREAASAAASEDSTQDSAQTAASADALPLLAEGFEYLGLDQSVSIKSGLANEPDQLARIKHSDRRLTPRACDRRVGARRRSLRLGLTRPLADPESAPAEDGQIDPGSAQAEVRSAVRETGAAPEADPAAGPEADSEQDAKREARQRDREARAIIRELLDELIADYASDARGVEIREIAGGFRMATKPECHDAVRGFVKSLKPALKLSLPALETLAVIAYKQPVTAPEVNEIRGVDSSGVFGSLLARKLIATAGRKQVIGRPILYKTTREFLLRFGLKDVSELPSMEEFEKMASLELDELEEAPGAESAAAATMDLDFEQDETGSDETPLEPEREED